VANPAGKEARMLMGKSRVRSGFKKDWEAPQPSPKGSKKPKSKRKRSKKR
jgi:hypothetical protein